MTQEEREKWEKQGFSQDQTGEIEEGLIYFSMPERSIWPYKCARYDLAF